MSTRNTAATLWANHQKKARFAVVGGCCFAINSVVLYILHRAGLGVAIAQVIGYEAGLLFGFFANLRWTYRHNERGSTGAALVKYHGSSLTALCLSTAIVVTLNKELELAPNLALIFGSGAALIWNYVIYDRYVFVTKQRNRRRSNEHDEQLREY